MFSDFFDSIIYFCVHKLFFLWNLFLVVLTTFKRLLQLLTPTIKYGFINQIFLPNSFVLPKSFYIIFGIFSVMTKLKLV